MGIKEKLRNGVNKIPPFRQLTAIQESLATMQDNFSTIQHELENIRDELELIHFDIDEAIDDVRFSFDREHAALKLCLLSPHLSRTEIDVASVYLSAPFDTKSKTIVSFTEWNQVIEELPNGFDVRHEAAITEALDIFLDPTDQDATHLTALKAARQFLGTELTGNSRDFSQEQKTTRLEIINTRIATLSNRIPQTESETNPLTLGE